MDKQTEKIKGFKGFSPDLTCRNFQYEVGKDYEETGKVQACKTGFHFCENPLDVLEYYPPSCESGLNRYCEVEGSGDKETDGDKIACSKIHISAEIGLRGLLDAGLKFILDRVKWKNNKEPNTGNRSAATNTGNWSAASVEGENSIAIVTGIDSRAKGALGCWIVLTERGDLNERTYPIKEVKAFKVDGQAVKAGTWYKLVNGELTIVN